MKFCQKCRKEIMKRFLFVLLVACIVVSLSACKAISTDIQTNSDTVSVQKNSESDNVTDKYSSFQIGDTIVTDNMNVTINDVAFSQVLFYGAGMGTRCFFTSEKITDTITIPIKA